MAKKKNSTKTYDQLRDEWYKKLAKEGFVDIESSETTLKEYTISKKQSKSMALVNWEANAQYYQMATNFYHDYAFADAFDKTVWLYHSEGMSNIEIAALLKQLYKKDRATSRDTISRTIIRLRKSMFAMYILPQGEYRE